MSSTKCCPFRLGLNVLKTAPFFAAKWRLKGPETTISVLNTDVILRHFKYKLIVA